MNQSLEEELQVLQAVYPEINIKTSNSSPNTIFSLQILPKTENMDTTTQYVAFVLEFSALKDSLSGSLPNIKIKDEKNINEDEVRDIEKQLNERAKISVGSPMLFDLIELSRDLLTLVNQPHGDCSICLCPIVEEDKDYTEDFVRTECSHIFHFHCLAEYALGIGNKKLRCPMCRVPLTDSLISELLNADLETTTDQSPDQQHDVPAKSEEVNVRVGPLSTNHVTVFNKGNPNFSWETAFNNILQPFWGAISFYPLPPDNLLPLHPFVEHIITPISDDNNNNSNETHISSSSSSSVSLLPSQISSPSPPLYPALSTLPTPKSIVLQFLNNDRANNMILNIDNTLILGQKVQCMIATQTEVDLMETWKSIQSNIAAKQKQQQQLQLQLQLQLEHEQAQQNAQQPATTEPHPTPSHKQQITIKQRPDSSRKDKDKDKDNKDKHAEKEKERENEKGPNNRHPQSSSRGGSGYRGGGRGSRGYSNQNKSNRPRGSSGSQNKENSKEAKESKESKDNKDR